MTTTAQFSGTYTALLTPMRDGRIDFDSLRKLVDFQIENGVAGLVPAGTTGESPTLDFEEHIAVIACVVDAAKGRVPVIAGSGANSTSEALHLTKQSELAGADAFLQVAPYYNKPSQEGLYRHYARIAESTEKPIVLYNVPGRTAVGIAAETVRRLAGEYPNVNTIKEAGGDCDQVVRILHEAPASITVLSGDDALTLPFIAVGASGVVSVISNILPKETVAMVDAALRNDFDAARGMHQRLFPLFRDFLAVASNPVPVKYAAARMEIIPSSELRLPMCELDDSGKQRIDANLKALGLI